MSDLRPRLPLQGPAILVLAVMAVAMERVLTQHWREGAALLGGALVLAAVLRVLLPVDRAGLLAIRSRGIDVLCYIGFGAVMIVLAVTITRNTLTLG